jgi:hypothetical protein
MVASRRFNDVTSMTTTSSEGSRRLGDVIGLIDALSSMKGSRRFDDEKKKKQKKKKKLRYFSK